MTEALAPSVRKAATAPAEDLKTEIDITNFKCPVPQPYASGIAHMHSKAAQGQAVMSVGVMGKRAALCYQALLSSF